MGPRGVSKHLFPWMLFEPRLEAIQEMKEKPQLSPSSSDNQATLRPR